MTPIRARWAALLILLAAMGCGQDDGIKLVPVVGTITLGGTPVADAGLSFVPEPINKQSTPGTAATGPAGNYSASYQARSGLAPGNYRVMVIPRPSSVSVPDEFKNDPMMAQFAADAARRPSASPKASAAKTVFAVKVEEAGGTFHFDLGPASGSDPKK